jgi:KDO2-lipid IV(A) lauroyltransferase
MVLNNENERSNYVIALLGDQNPANTNNVYWASNFLNQETAFLNGPAKMAKRFNIPMVYLSSTKLKRGVYEAHTELLVANPSLVSESEISEILVKRIEQEIISQPEIWLWSHRRWKYQKKRH